MSSEEVEWRRSPPIHSDRLGGEHVENGPPLHARAEVAAAVVREGPAPRRAGTGPASLI
jgi:hypothetical protein